MHELTLAAEICHIAERAAGPARAPRVRAVGIEVGEDAGVEPENLAFCLDVLLQQPPFGRAAAHLTRLAGTDLRVTYLEVDDDRPDDRGP